MTKTSLILGIAVVVVIAAVALVFLLPSIQQKETSAPLVIRVYVGEIGATKYGFGFSKDRITSPGPDIRVKVGTKIQIIFKNIGSLPHTFAITTEKKFDAEPLWNVQLGTPTKPVGAGEEKSITFTPNRAGEFFYICQVPGHIELGNWGKVIVEE